MSTNKVQLWFETNGGESKFQLPVNPEKITIKYSAHTDTVYVGSLGDVVIPGKAKAAQISFSSILPANYFSGCSVRKPLSPWQYVMILEAFVKFGTVVKFRITDRHITMTAIVDSFQYSEKGGDVGTFEYSITLKEYKCVKPRQIDLNKNTGKATVPKQTSVRTNTKEVPKTYTVKSGDCLWNLAKKFYNDGSKYTKIYEANKSIIGVNPNLIYPGQVLKIP